MSAFRRVMPSLLCALLLVGLARQTRPCEYRRVDPRHTMCAFRPGQCSGKSLLRTGGITCKDIETIISTHNTLRQKLSMGQVRNQPPALNMRAMEWDDELAAVAQRWADQCMPGHDRSRNVPSTIVSIARKRYNYSGADPIDIMDRLTVGTSGHKWAQVGTSGHWAALRRYSE
ncbi:venom allergen 5-like [Penaeus monodon]|uniref:venom allergen 5-like n=1 Tax=Penaeus monodon TaxID=6687 RepID=UPI0018A731D2|nr:venom allergen 5-like [Penaeus monodon]